MRMLVSQAKPKVATPDFTSTHPTQHHLTPTHLSDLAPPHLTYPGPQRTMVVPPSPSPSSCLTSHLSMGTLAAG